MLTVTQELRNCIFKLFNQFTLPKIQSFKYWKLLMEEVSLLKPHIWSPTKHKKSRHVRYCGSIVKQCRKPYQSIALALMIGPCCWNQAYSSRSVLTDPESPSQDWPKPQQDARPSRPGQASTGAADPDKASWTRPKHTMSGQMPRQKTTGILQV